MTDHVNQFVGWAERAADLIDDRDDGRGHGALRLSPPYACCAQNLGRARARSNNPDLSTGVPMPLVLTV